MRHQNPAATAFGAVVGGLPLADRALGPFDRIGEIAGYAPAGAALGGGPEADGMSWFAEYCHVGPVPGPDLR
ncbi:hypothetical protein [Kitasatospora aureofaciens]|uniref:hypothetical protein n=1 Tax=Kitasatospora aureofaciens TaxID=1894 RepID=UPI003826190F